MVNGLNDGLERCGQRQSGEEEKAARVGGTHAVELLVHIAGHDARLRGVDKVEPWVSQGDDRDINFVHVHEVHFLLKRGIVRGQRPARRLCRRVLGSFIKSLLFRGEKDEARIRCLREAAHNGNGGSRFEDLDVRRGVHVSVDVHHLHGCGRGHCVFSPKMSMSLLSFFYSMLRCGVCGLRHRCFFFSCLSLVSPCSIACGAVF
ncbi:uncharacterized protein CTRU02_212977 [Colletotrichum truncatum]|uniref:Uncharacterized protein n=1 Tax=Colletotrichum truncatum TaxID=5467 RepID=A0ACC3YJH9_COLTU|nr:uncharacterized protein CTRU02_03299 [Colletotrichum truncatum]KAF6797268.1 hypothetical protein CTRU02_03299 [Colletotrichum truncatum]